MILRIENLCKNYGKKVAVDNFSMQVKKGEVIGILGPNGAGKTSSFYMICGLVKPNKGKIFFKDKDITQMPLFERAKIGIGYLPQEASIFKPLNVKDNIMSGIEVRYKNNMEQGLKKYEEIINDLNIQNIQYRKASLLSGGERRRAEVGRLLGTSPEVILLDEPFAGVDPVAISEIRDIIHALKFRGISVVITDHNVREALQIAERSYVMYNGKIIAEGNSEQICNNALVRKVYLGDSF